MDLSIIIVNYKSKAKLKTCIESILNEDLEGLAWEVILVENDSGDDLSDVVPYDKEIRLILSKKNLGMGGGNNLGIREARGDFILVLNPDTVLKRGAIKTMHSHIKSDENIGMIGPKLLYPDGSLQISCLRFPSFFVPILRRTFLGDFFKVTRDKFTMTDFDHSHIKQVDWLMGSCLMFRKEIQLKSGDIFRPEFDERYFMYFEDTDLGRQFKEKGLQVIYDPNAIVIHDHARQSAKNPWYIALFKDSLVWIHISSWFKYFAKWSFKYKNK